METQVNGEAYRAKERKKETNQAHVGLSWNPFLAFCQSAVFLKPSECPENTDAENLIKHAMLSD